MSAAKTTFWRKCRVTFRWCRIAVLLAIFFFLAALAYLNRVGLPDFIKAPVLAELRARGLDLNFTRLRLSAYHGLLAENVRLGTMGQAAAPQFFVKEMDVRVNRAALLRGEIVPTALFFRQGDFTFPLVETNQPPQQLRLEAINTELRFLPNDQWELDNFRAESFGVKIKLSGTLTNASLVRSWKSPGQTNAPPSLRPLREFANAMEKIRFAAPPEIRIHVRADGRDPRSLRADLTVAAVGALTPWGAADDLLGTARWLPTSVTNHFADAEIHLRAGQLKTDWGIVQHGHLTGKFSFASAEPLPVSGDWKLELASAQTDWGSAQDFSLAGSLENEQAHASATPRLTRLTGTAENVLTKWGRAQSAALKLTAHNSATNWIPLAAEGNLSLRHPQTDHGTAEQAQLEVQMTQAPADIARRADASWAWWAKLAPFQLDWRGEFSDVSLSKLLLQKVSCAGQWRAPALEISQLKVDLFEKHLEGTARLDIVSRVAQANTRFDFDVHRIEPLLTTNAQRWMRRHEWVSPPLVEAEGRLRLPAWTNRHPDWRGEVKPTMWLAGKFSVGEAAFRTIPIQSAESHFGYSNSVWHLPDMVVMRPEGRIDLNIVHSSRTEEYQIDLSGTVDPKALTPFFGEENQRALDSFEFRQPARAVGSIWGPWNEGKGAIVGTLQLTNFLFRGEPFDDLTGQVFFTNQLVQASNAVAHLAGGTVTAQAAAFDTEARRLWLTNAHAHVNPLAITKIIGPKTTQLLEPYHFENPPEVEVNGTLLVGKIPRADLRFDLSGGPFQWRRFRLTQLTSEVRWLDDSLTITNLQSSFYKGRLTGGARFDFPNANTTDYSFGGGASGVDLRLLMNDIATATNKLEGLIDGELTVTSATTTNPLSWQGFGRLHLRDGLIWDIPAFGIFSQPLNVIHPGLGNSRADESTATFKITNSVIDTRDLEIHASAMRLLYKGTVDFKGNINAVVEAKLLRDMWGVGPIFSVVLSPLTKMFEYRVTGTLGQPKKEPLFIPKFLMMPFHPLRTLRDLFPGNPEPPPKSSGTPAETSK